MARRPTQSISRGAITRASSTLKATPATDVDHLDSRTCDGPPERDDGLAGPHLPEHPMVYHAAVERCRQHRALPAPRIEARRQPVAGAHPVAQTDRELQ